jgi:PilZ domain
VIPSASPLSALVLSTDVHASTASTGMLESHGFAVSKTDDSVVARELCRRKRFDLAVYDQDSSYDQDAAGASTLFGTPHVVLGLVGCKTAGQPLGKRIHFLVQKPFTGDMFRKALKAAYGTIASSRRFSFRHEVCIHSISPCLIFRGERRPLKIATIMNISRGGMCIETGELLPQQANIRLSFSIPGSGTIVHATGTIIWAHASGRAGIKLVGLNSEAQPYFGKWLDSLSPRAEDLLPHPIAKIRHGRN